VLRSKFTTRHQQPDVPLRRAAAWTKVDENSFAAALDLDALAPVASAALGSPAEPTRVWVARVYAEPILAPATRTLVWVSGEARVGGAIAPWFAVVKVLGPTEGHSREATGPGGYGYWRREADAYSSGVLEDLGASFEAPRCYAVEERSDGTIWLWLEAIDTIAAWFLDRK
jgi:hypothetical protein